MVNTERRRILLDIANLTFAGYLIQIVMFGANIYVRRDLGPFFAGVFATLALVAQYTQYANLGVLQVAERELPRLRGAGDEARVARVRAGALLLSTAGGTLVAGVVGAWAFLYRNSIDPALFRGLIVWGIVGIGTQCTSTYLVILRSDKRFAFLARCSVVFAFLTAILNVLCVRLFGFDGLLWVALGLSLLGLAVYATASRYFPRRQDLTNLRANLFPEMKTLLLLGVPMLILVLSQLALHTVDNVVALRLLGTEGLGIYTLALSGGAVVFTFANTLTMVLYPRMQEAYGKAGAVQALSQFVVRPTLLFSTALPLLIAPLFWGVPFVFERFLPKFASGIPAFRILVVGISFYALLQISATCLISLNRIFQLVALYLGTSAACAASSFVFVRAGWGITGVAVGTSVGYFIGFAAITMVAHRHWSDWKAIAKFLTRTTLPVVYGGILFSILMWAPLNYGKNTWVAGLLWVCFKVVLFYVAYLPFLIATDRESGLIKDHIQPRVRALWARLRKPTL